MDNDKPTYRTRYGEKTADEAAQDLLDRAWAKIRFLEEVFTAVNEDGDDFNMRGYANRGLAAILEDIAHDLYAVYAYHDGDDPEPGKDA